MKDKEIERAERTLVVFEGRNGVEYKIPTHSCIDLKSKDKLNCSDVDCFSVRELNCHNCIFHGKSVDKDQLKFMVRGLKVIKDDQMKENKETKRFVEFEDKEGKTHLLPMLNNTIDDGKLSCKNVSCVYYNITCDKCPLSNGFGLSVGEFKILRLKLEDNE